MLSKKRKDWLLKCRKWMSVDESGDISEKLGTKK